MTWHQCKCKCKQNGLWHIFINQAEYDNLDSDYKNNSGVIFFVQEGSINEETGEFAPVSPATGTIYRYGIPFCHGAIDSYITEENLPNFFPDTNGDQKIDAGDASNLMEALTQLKDGIVSPYINKSAPWRVMGNPILSFLGANLILAFSDDKGAANFSVNPKIAENYPNLPEDFQYYLTYLGFGENSNMVNYELYCILDEALNIIEDIEDESEKNNILNVWKVFAQSYINLIRKEEQDEFITYLQGRDNPPNTWEEYLALSKQEKRQVRQDYNLNYPGNFIERHQNWKDILYPEN